MAELALDDIRLSAPGGIKEQAIVEVELAEGAPREVLEAIARVLRDEWSLEAESRSKYQLALEAAESLAGPSAANAPEPGVAVKRGGATLKRAASAKPKGSGTQSRRPTQTRPRKNTPQEESAEIEGREVPAEDTSADESRGGRRVGSPRGCRGRR